MELPPPQVATIVLSWWLFGNILFASVWDIVWLFFGHGEYTVSLFLYQTAEANPKLYLLAGIMIGHLFFGLVVQNGRPQ